MAERFNYTLQENTITILAYSDEHGKVVARLITPDLFEGDYRVVATRILAYWQQFEEAPKVHTADLFDDILSDQHNRKAGTFRRILTNMLALSEGMNTNYIVEQVRQFAEVQRMKAAILKSAEQINAKQEHAVDEIKAIWNELLRDRQVDFDPGLRLSEYDKVLAAMAVQQSEFRTGIKVLDDRNIVPYRRAMLLLLGAAKRGKCIAAGQKVLMPNGERKSIETVVRDKDRYVLSLNEETGEIVVGTILNWHTNGVKRCYRLTTTSGRFIDTTPDHEYLTQRGWVKLNEIRPGVDYIAVPWSQEVVFELVRSFEPIGRRPTYDLTVKKYHNFIAEDVVVHNSWGLIHIGKHALLQRKKVVHVTLEMSAEEVGQRYYQSLFAIPKRQAEIELTTFQRDKRGELEEFVTKVVRPEFAFDSPHIATELETRILYRGLLFENLIIKKFPMRSLSMDMLEGYLDNLEVTEKFIPDMLILDYIGITKTDAKNHRISLGRNGEDFRGILDRRHLAGVTAQQISKEGAEAFQSGSKHVAEDWSLIATADQIWALASTTAEKQYGLARLFVDLARGEGDSFGALITQSFSTGQFCLDSLFLKSQYFEMLKDLGGNDEEVEEDGEED